MENPLIAKARAGRLLALATLPNRGDNVVSLSRRRADLDAIARAVPFASVRRHPATVRLVA